MKIRRVTIEVEVPWEVPADPRATKMVGHISVLTTLGLGFGELQEFIPYQAQVVKDELSTNIRIGEYTRFPCKP